MVVRRRVTISLSRSLSSSGVRFVSIVPLEATEIEPVSSETSTTMASLSSVIPMAARCRVPSDFDKSGFSDNGKRHPAAAIRRLAPDGVDRVVEVALSANADLDAAVVRNGAVLAAYASGQDRPELPFWPMLFNNLTIRLLGSDDFPAEAKDAAAGDLTVAAAQSALSIPVAETFPLARIAAAHELIESGKAAGRVLVSLPQASP